MVTGLRKRFATGRYQLNGLFGETEFFYTKGDSLLGRYRDSLAGQVVPLQCGWLLIKSSPAINHPFY
jgi:hypothetical protein